MLFSLICAAICLAVAVFTLLALIFKVPTSKFSGNINKLSKLSQSSKSLTTWFTEISIKLSHLLPLTMMKEIKTDRMLAAADIKLSAKAYLVRNYLLFLSICLLGSPLMLIHPLLEAIPLVIALLAVYIIQVETKSKGRERLSKIERDLPQFIATFTNSIKTNRNVIDILETYINNLDSEFTRELSICVADMKTGTAEVALERLERRVNLPVMTELVKGIISSLRGEEMDNHFDSLNEEASKIWQHQLRAQALRIPPKISTFSLLRAMLAIVIFLFVLAVAAFSGGGFSGI